MTRPFLLGALVAALAGCSSGTAAAPPPPRDAGEVDHDAIQLAAGSPHLSFLKIETVAESDDAPAAMLTGKVAFDENHTQRVASPIDGRVVNLLVEPGDKVASGQILLELSSPTMGQMQGDARKALQDLTLTQKSLDRAMTLKADGAVSEKEIAQVESDYRKAKSDVASTASRLRSLNVGGSDSASIRAQLAGTVVERNVLRGQEVRADGAQPLLTISNLDVVWVVGDVYEQDLGLVHQGAEVSVSVPAYPGSLFAGTIGRIADVVDAVTHTVKLRCVVPNADGRLKPEMFAKIQLRDSGTKKIVISAKAVLSDTQPPRVVVATEGNRFQLRKVDIGPEVGGRVRILSGLAVGEKIVAEGAIFLKQQIDGQ